jgi:hypothetical protein
MIDLPKKEDAISDHSDSWRCWVLSQTTTGCTSSDAGWDRNLRFYFGLKRAGAENKLDRMHDFMHRHGHLARVRTVTQVDAFRPRLSTPGHLPAAPALHARFRRCEGM